MKNQPHCFQIFYWNDNHNNRLVHRMRQGGQEKRAIRFGGGGASAVYGVGCALALDELTGEDKIEIAFGASGGAPTAACYAANQLSQCSDLWDKAISNPDIMRGGLFELGLRDPNLQKRIRSTRNWRELYDILFKAWIDVDKIMHEHVIPILDVEYLRRESLTEVLIAVTDYETGLPTHFSSKEKVPFLDVVDASMNIPIVRKNPRPIYIGGRRYIDGDLAEIPLDSMQVAAEKGVTTFINVVNSSLEDLTTLATFWKAGADHNIMRAVRSRIEATLALKPPTGMEVITITSREPLLTGTFNNDPDVIYKIRQLGYQDTINNRQLYEHLNRRAKGLT